MSSALASSGARPLVLEPIGLARFTGTGSIELARFIGNAGDKAFEIERALATCRALAAFDWPSRPCVWLRWRPRC